MKRYALILIFMLSGNALAMCLPKPEILFSMYVHSCQSVSIGPSEMDFKVNSEQTIKHRFPGQDGVLITGTVVESELVTKSSRSQFFLPREAFKTKSIQSVFVLGEESKICIMNVEETTQFVTSRPCCDTGAIHGACSVPGGLTLVKFVIDRKGWYTLEEASNE